MSESLDRVIEPRSRLADALTDRYRIERVIGEGGMATVHLAHDLRHDRRVALKVLRPELSAVIGAERFLAEIKTTANLQHPHILPLHDSGTADGLVFYVMPYVEGESLRARLTREKQLPVEEAVRIACEVADALDYAHRHGVIHRDIKPENVMLHDGRALVADFGIALAVSGSDGGKRMTETGLSLGTPFYMSPEQAMGQREITPKSDVYALGCVLYEMLLGEPPFTGPTAQAIVARVLTEEPRGLTVQRRSIPPYVEAAVQKALAKLPADRFGSAAAFAAALRTATSVQLPVSGSAPHSTALAPTPTRLRLALAGAAIGLLLLVAGGFLGNALARQAPSPERASWVSVLPPAGSFPAHPAPALSPDGSQVAFVAPNAEGVAQLWIRPLDSPIARALPGTEGIRFADFPFWSPDGQSLGFFADGSLKRVSVAGGSPQVLADAINPRGGTWGRDGTIVFVPTSGSPLYRVPAAGGISAPLFEPVADADGGAASFFWPHFLPDGRHILFMSEPRTGGASVYVTDLSGNEIRPVLTAFSKAEYAEGRILFGRNSELFAQPFDLDRLEVSGEAVRVASDLGSLPSNGAFEFSAAGPNVVLSNARQLDLHQLTWYARTGERQGTAGPPGAYWGFDLSSDELQAVVERDDPTTTLNDLRLIDLASGSSSLLFGDPNASAGRPVWMPDGSAVMFVMQGFVYLHPTNGTELEQVPFDGVVATPTSVSRDGKSVIVQLQSPETLNDMALLDLSADRQSVTYLSTQYNESQGEISPDGRWIAYRSDESGAFEVYVQSFPKAGNKVRVSREGGGFPKWSPDGAQLYYLEANGGMLLATSATQASETIRFSPPVPLFSAPRTTGDTGRDQYAPTRDGRFLFNERIETVSPPAITVGLNWAAGLDGGR